LSINANNNLEIKMGMVFHVRLTFKDVGGKGPVALADTVVVSYDGETKILTEAAPRKYKHISYTIDDEDEDEKSDDEAEDGHERNGRTNGDADGEPAQILPTRTRGARQQEANAEREQDLKRGQDELLDDKLEELKLRFENNEIQMGTKKQKQKDMGKIQSYSSVKKFPADLKKG
jgi:hypothetical protein